jgi:hypothetical protein
MNPISVVIQLGRHESDVDVSNLLTVGFFAGQRERQALVLAYRYVLL